MVQHNLTSLSTTGLVDITMELVLSWTITAATSSSLVPCLVSIYLLTIPTEARVDMALIRLLPSTLLLELDIEQPYQGHQMLRIIEGSLRRLL